MKRKRITKIIFYSFIVLLIGTNITLLITDEDNYIDRMSYIKEWSEIFTHDLYERTLTEGVLASSEETPVYFEESQGAFQQFLVEEGDTVTEGQPLFEYRVKDYDVTLNRLEQEVEKLTGEITAIETALRNINTYQISLPETNPDPLRGFGDEDDETESEEQTDTSDTEYMKEQYLTEKELELEQKQAALQAAEAQLAELTSEGSIVTVNSPAPGKIEEIETDLKNPVVTLQSENLHIEGELPETDRKRIEVGMPVNIHIDDVAGELEGEIKSIADSPNEVSINNTSFYPFEVEMDEAETEVLPGYHTNLEIITDQFLEAPTVKMDHITQAPSPAVWVMTPEGTVYLQEVELGLAEAGFQGLTSGVEVGETIAEEPKGRLIDQSPFVTPIRESKVQWKKMAAAGDYAFNKASFLTGVISR
ncbi:efflux RND transporter periplasmic adaptor subunit [Sediminibacillus massiliensis]|uniref:efflux RND transporter periplasmic adaptor subunit n=1 Tax=Sediminibacillus massiliensis TaxID=1926277 RepID=UPI0015C2DFEA|nr:HlyD family efflux transporter periplasmic adaptor subunit [Sediminibacillus massiliensis]